MLNINKISTDFIANGLKVKTKVLPSEYAEQNRVLSSDISAIQGQFSYDHTPYLREIVNCLDDENPARIIAVQKAAQIGFTEGVIVNGILWIIANNPANIMSLSADDTLSREMIESRLDQGISSCGIEHMIRPNTLRVRHNRTGHTSTGKEFVGGRLFAGGVKSVNKLGKQRSIKYMFADDWEASESSDKEQGNIYELLQQRFASFASEMKQFYISTPHTHPSKINEIFLKGDQCKWHVQCPCCGEYITYLWRDKVKGTKVGITFDLEDNRLIEGSVGYTCQKCFGTFLESKKYQLNLGGKWISTAKPYRSIYRSFHINALATPPSMYSWTDYIYKWLDIGTSISKRKVFYNVVLGDVWHTDYEGITKKNRLMHNCRNYQVGVIPEELSEKDGNGKIVFIAASADLNGESDDARLDYEVVAYSQSGSSYSIDQGSIGTFVNISLKGSNYVRPQGKDRVKYNVFMGQQNNVWDIFAEEVLNRSWDVDSGGEGRHIDLTAIDTGKTAQYVYTFIDHYAGKVVGIKGTGTDTYKKYNLHYKKYKISTNRYNLYIVDSDLYKDDIAEFSILEHPKGGIQPNGFMNFPESSEGKYKYNTFFRQFDSEQKKLETNAEGDIIGWKWRKVRSMRNDFLDCRVYNLALKDIYLEFLNKVDKNKVKLNWVEYFKDED